MMAKDLVCASEMSCRYAHAAMSVHSARGIVQLGCVQPGGCLAERHASMVCSAVTADHVSTSKVASADLLATRQDLPA